MPVDPAQFLAQVGPGAARILPLRDVGARGEAVDGREHGGQGGVGDLAAVGVALADGRQRAVRGGPDVARVHLLAGLQDGDAPAGRALGDGPVERGGSAVADGSRVDDQAGVGGPDLPGDGRLEHRREHEVRPVALDGFGEGGAGQGELDRHTVPAVPQLSVHTLSETVERAGGEQDVHVISQASGPRRPAAGTGTAAGDRRPRASTGRLDLRGCHSEGDARAATWWIRDGRGTDAGPGPRRPEGPAAVHRRRAPVGQRTSKLMEEALSFMPSPT